MKLNRRQFVLAGFASRVLAQSPAAAPLFDRGFAQVSKIADGVYATIANSA
jgi:hypothetical protein